MAKYMDSENFKHFWNNILKPNLLKKVDKVSGKGLSTNDFTDTYKNAIGSLQDSVGALNTTKVDKVIGKDLSTNDFTNEYKDLIVANKDAISKLKGFIYPCTAQALEDMTQEQQAELHTQGYRAIKTENNGTVVLLGLGSDGSLEWLGSNKPRRNLLDNPNFAVAQAGHGGFHGLTLYAADMWLYNGEAGQVSFNGGLVIETQYTVYQRTQNALNDGKTRTVVVRTATSTGCLILEGGYVPVGATGYSATYDTGNAVYINKNTADAGALVSVELYEGNYTPKTLPPWEVARAEATVPR